MPHFYGGVDSAETPDYEATVSMSALETVALEATTGEFNLDASAESSSEALDDDFGDLDLALTSDEDSVSAAKDDDAEEEFTFDDDDFLSFDIDDEDEKQS